MFMCAAAADEPADIFSARMKILEPDTIFLGNVRVVQEGFLLWADEVRRNSRTGRLEAKGNLRVERTRRNEEGRPVTWKIRGERARYSEKTGDGRIQGDAQLTEYDEAGRPVWTIAADELAWFGGESTTTYHAKGRVRLAQENEVLTCDESWYFAATATFLAVGNARLRFLE